MPANSKQTKKLLRLISALSDMQDAIEAADLLLSGAPDKLYPHLFLSMVVAYGRPFTSNHGLGPLTCEFPDFRDFSDPEIERRHSRLMDLRNKFLAHSSSEGTQVLIFPPGVTNPLANNVRTEWDYNIGKRAFTDIKYVEWLRVVPVAFKERLQFDIRQLLLECFGRDAGLNASFALPTEYENFKWSNTLDKPGD